MEYWYFRELFKSRAWLDGGWEENRSRCFHMPSMAAAQEMTPEAGPSSAAWSLSPSIWRETREITSWCLSGERTLGKGRCEEEQSEGNW